MSVRAPGNDDDEWEDITDTGDDEWEDITDEFPVAKPKPSLLKRAYDWGMTPLTDAPSRFARSISQDFDLPTKEGNVHPLAAFGRGATEGLGDLLSGLSSPLNIAATALPIGAFGAASRGLKNTANLMRQGARLASAPVAYHGGETILDPNKSLAEKAFGVAELAGGAAGMHFPESALRFSDRTPKPITEPIVEPTITPEPVVKPTIRPEDAAARALEKQYDSSSPNPEISDTPLTRARSAEQIAADEELLNRLFPGMEKSEPKRRFSFDQMGRFLEDEEGSFDPDALFGRRYPAEEVVDLGEVPSRDIDLDQAALEAGSETAKPVGRGFSERAKQFLTDESGEFNPGAIFREPQSPLEVEHAFDWPGFGKEGEAEPMFHVRGGPEDKSTLSRATLRERGMRLNEPLNEFSPDVVQTNEDVFGGTSPKFTERLPAAENMPEITPETIPEKQGGFMQTINDFMADESGEIRFDNDFDKIQDNLRNRRMKQSELDPEYVSTRLAEAGTGAPGFSTQQVRPDLYYAVYRDPQGNPVAMAKISKLWSGDEFKVQDFAADKTKGLLYGRGVKSLLDHFNEQGITGATGSVTDDTMKLIDSARSRSVGGKVKDFLTEESGEANPEALFPPKQEQKVPFGRLPGKQELAPNLPVQERAVPEAQEPSMARQIWDLPRGTMSVDLPFLTSAAFRQASPLAWTKGWFEAWGKSAKSFGSEEAYKAIMDDINKSEFFKPRYKPSYDAKGNLKGYKEMPGIAEDVGLKMSDMGRLSNREEQIRGSLAERIPGWGKYIKASNRAYTAFLNSARKSQFESMMKQAAFTGGENDMVIAKQIAEFINDATGRSPLKLKVPGKEFNFEKNSEMLANGLWSPRLLASRIRMLNPMTYTGLDPMVRQEYVKGLMRSAATWMGFAGLASMAGAKVSLDPTNADFGKIRIGDTRIDPGAGFQQVLVFMSRMAPESQYTGKYTSSVTGKTSKYGEGFKGRTRADVAEDFASSKLHPTLKLAYDLLKANKERPVHLGDRAVQMALPMMAQDIAEVMKGNPDLAIGMAPLSSVGFGTSTYGGKDSMSNPVFTDSIEKFLGAKPKSLRGTVKGF